MPLSNLPAKLEEIHDAALAVRYMALRQGAAVWAPPAAEPLPLTDVDRSDFLQRMTTNDIKRLRAGSSCVTVLTSPTAKIVQVFTVLAGSDQLWLLPAAGQGAALERHLRGQIFLWTKYGSAGRAAYDPAAAARAAGCSGVGPCGLSQAAAGRRRLAAGRGADSRCARPSMSCLAMNSSCPPPMQRRCAASWMLSNSTKPAIQRGGLSWGVLPRG
jgi:hypothetical protein